MERFITGITGIVMEVDIGGKERLVVRDTLPA
jgi:hypothetical protein